MTAIELLLLLVALAYLASILLGGRTIRGFGLPSGAEYLVLGFLLGPHALDVAPRAVVEGTKPLLMAAVGWVALILGVSALHTGARRVALGRLVAGVLQSAAAGALVGAVVWWALRQGGLAPGDALLGAGIAGAIASETTRHSVRWVIERHGASGPVSDLSADLARVSALVPPLALGLLFAVVPGQTLFLMPLWARVGGTVALGVVLGATVAFLLGREFRRDESWGILLGAALLGIGVTAHFGLSVIATLFFMGFTLACTPHGLDIKLMVAPTEKPVLLPVTLTVGSLVSFAQPSQAFAIVALALIVKLVGRSLIGALVGRALGVRAASFELGLSTLACGELSVITALSFQLRRPGEVAEALILFAAASAVLGELVGPATLRRALRQNGELHSVRQALLPASVAFQEREPGT